MLKPLTQVLMVLYGWYYHLIMEERNLLFVCATFHQDLLVGGTVLRSFLIGWPLKLLSIVVEGK